MLDLFCSAVTSLGRPPSPTHIFHIFISLYYLVDNFSHLFFNCDQYVFTHPLRFKFQWLFLEPLIIFQIYLLHFFHNVFYFHMSSFFYIFSYLKHFIFSNYPICKFLIRSKRIILRCFLTCFMILECGFIRGSLCHWG